MTGEIRGEPEAKPASVPLKEKRGKGRVFARREKGLIEEPDTSKIPEAIEADFQRARQRRLRPLDLKEFVGGKAAEGWRKFSCQLPPKTIAELKVFCVMERMTQDEAINMALLRLIEDVAKERGKA